MTKYRLLSLFTAMLFINISYGQYKGINIAVHANLNNYSHALSNYNEVLNNKQQNYYLNPRIAYRFNKTWAAGVSYQNAISKSSSSYQHRNISNSYGIFVQSYVFDNGKIAAFLELDANKGSRTSKFKHPENNYFQEDSKSDLFSTGMHAGGRYTFYKGLGAEIRLNNLIQYYKSSMKNTVNNYSSFQLFENILKNSSIGISYQF